MKNNIKILDTFELSSGKIIIFAVEVNLDYYLIGTVFINLDTGLKFKLKGIGNEAANNVNNKSFRVEIIGDYNNINQFVGLVFIVED